MALEIVARHIASKWRSLAWQLDVPEEVIETSDKNNSNDIAGKASEVLRQWKKIQGRSASWATVEKALLDLGRKDIVDGRLF